MAKKKNKSKSAGGAKSAKASSGASSAKASESASAGPKATAPATSAAAPTSKAPPKTVPPKTATKSKPKEKAPAPNPAAAAIVEVFESGNFAAVRQIAATVEAGNYPAEVVDAAMATKERVKMDPVAIAIGLGGVLLVVVVVLSALTPSG